MYEYIRRILKRLSNRMYISKSSCQLISGVYIHNKSKYSQGVDQRRCGKEKFVIQAVL